MAFGGSQGGLCGRARNCRFASNIGMGPVPSGYVKIAIEAIEIVSFPMKNDDYDDLTVAT